MAKKLNNVVEFETEVQEIEFTSDETQTEVTETQEQVTQYEDKKICPKNSEIKKQMIELFDSGWTGSSKELRDQIIYKMNLSQEQLEERCVKKDGTLGEKRFKIRFSVQLSELNGKDYIEKDDKGIYRKANHEQ
jgi:hypothetical protein